MTSYSKLQAHRECPQKYAYRYVHRLTSLADARNPDPEMGSWWHLLRAADAMDRGAKGPNVLEVDERVQLRPADVDTTLVDAAWKLLGRWEKSLTNSTMDKWVETFGAAPYDRLADMDAEWRERWQDETAHEEPLLVEVKFSRPLPDLRDPLSGASVPTSENLVGYIDEIYRDKRRGFVVARDYKSHRKLDGSTGAAEALDSQLHLYAWGSAPMLKEMGIPQVRAVAYDRIRATAPKQPKVTQAGKLSASVKDYSLRTYLNWVADGVPFPGAKKDGSAAGLYTVEDKVVENLSDPASRSAWTQRSLTPLNMSVIKSHLSAAALTHIDSTRTEKLVEQLGEAPRNFTRSCKFCDFRELCVAQMIGGNDGDYDLAALGLAHMQRRGRGR